MSSYPLKIVLYPIDMLNQLSYYSSTVTPVEHNQKEDKTMSTCGFDLFPPRDVVEDYLENLNEINLQIAELKRIKDALERRVLEHLAIAKFDEQNNVVSVAHEGSQTKRLGKYKVTFKTTPLWKIDKDEYLAVASKIRAEFNPIITSTSYRVSNDILKAIDTYGDESDKHILGEFLTMDYSKPSITITTNS